jgi:phenylpropionate dioxygenase-like ring-hydroxylating dioxygenase large terminal subunit
MWIRNAWYVAAWSHEISGDGLLARTIMNEPLVLYRTGNGSVVAMEDRCCHRLAPLSLGRREGDDLRCMYHGLKVGPDGRCNEIPGQTTIPDRAVGPNLFRGIVRELMAAETSTAGGAETARAG